MNALPGTLSIVGTPIGNMEDITLRALRVLREADLIAAEDTRHTARLLARHGISKPLVSYHEFNEAKRTPELLQMLQNGRRIALASDAGMPTLSDPGTRLIRAVLEVNAAARNSPGSPPAEGPGVRAVNASTSNIEHRTSNFELRSPGSPPPEGLGVGSVPAGKAARNSVPYSALSLRGGGEIPRHVPQFCGIPSNDGTRNDKPIEIEVIPGPSAVTAALAGSGFSGKPFLFHGFLPHKGAQRRKVLSDLAPLPCTLVFFESPYRLVKSLADMLDILGDRPAVVARELTKKFEEISHGRLGALLKSLENRRIKGEITVVVEGCVK